MVLLFGATLLAIARVGCNTAHSSAKDVQNTGGGSVTGCASHPYPPSMSRQIESDRTRESVFDQRSDQRMEESRTAERVREALAAGADYKYDRVKVEVRDSVVQLSGVVNTSVQRNRAGEVTRKVVGVERVQNDLTVRD